MTLGKRIRRARKRLNLTQEDIATKFGISYQAVSQWERDERLPELDKLPELRKILKVNYYWLLEGANNAPPDAESPEVVIEDLSPTEHDAITTGVGAMIEVLRKQRRSA